MVGLGAGLLCGAFNGFWVAYAGLPSLAVTLAGLIGYRGMAEMLVEDRSIGNFPDWFNHLGQQPLLGPLPLSLIIFFVLLIIFVGRAAFFRLRALRLSSSATTARLPAIPACASGR